MDWLSRYQTTIDCAQRRVTQFTKNGQVVYQANHHAIRTSPILRSFIGDKQRLETYSNLFVIESEVETKTYYPGLHVVEEFLDVFLDELSGLPPDREIEFCIDLIPGAEPIYVPSYRITLVELTELRN